MKKLYLLSILTLTSIALIYSCSSEEEDTPPPPSVVVTPESEPTAPTQYTLIVTAGEGGTVSTEGGTYDEGAEVTITATPDEGFEFVRPGEKIAIRIFKGLNYLGVLKSLKPLPVSKLADKMIGEAKSNKKVKFKLYSSLEI